MGKLILASGSKRRIELLHKLDIPFEVIVPDVDESVYENEDPFDYVTRVSRDKAYSVFKCHSDCAVISADTIVFNGKILGKPKDREEAYQMIRSLSGKSHNVITGVTMIEKRSGEVHSFHVITEVIFDTIPDDDILSYIQTDEPYDKAGGYAIQGTAGKFIRRINGCYYNVMGFPLNEIYRRMMTLNIS
ncbi:MAG: septum formation inhibitor Maf [Clostridia bacterium]|nr:septum formation inhibitor Maf [Clostridia bacterium]